MWANLFANKILPSVSILLLMLNEVSARHPSPAHHVPREDPSQTFLQTTGSGLLVLVGIGFCVFTCRRLMNANPAQHHHHFFPAQGVGPVNPEQVGVPIIQAPVIPMQPEIVNAAGALREPLMAQADDLEAGRVRALSR